MSCSSLFDSIEEDSLLFTIPREELLILWDQMDFPTSCSSSSPSSPTRKRKRSVLQEQNDSDYDSYDTEEDDDKKRLPSVVIKHQKCKDDIKSSRPNFSASQIKVFHQWVIDHIDYPYPTKRDKEDLAKTAELEVKQVESWFNNFRKRIWLIKNPGFEREKKRQQIKRIRRDLKPWFL